MISSCKQMSLYVPCLTDVVQHAVGGQNLENEINDRMLFDLCFTALHLKIKIKKIQTTLKLKNLKLPTILTCILSNSL